MYGLHITMQLCSLGMGICFVCLVQQTKIKSVGRLCVYACACLCACVYASIGSSH